MRGAPRRRRRAQTGPPTAPPLEASGYWASCSET
jgi:hypothetical protein